ncbi:hypothetical protein M885DRAFT_282652 [Pelagophyceae sp. CCMP2097]|nr:hypothetical protein M885DRAFT_282652 [Pelagophyceae sp. CCMP2097]
MNQAKWWWNTHAMYVGEKSRTSICPIRLFIDGATAGGASNLSLCPVLFDCGNFPAAMCRNDNLKGCAGFIPGSTRFSKTEKAALESNVLLEHKHRCLDHVVAPIRECLANGGFTADLPGIGKWTFLPFIAWIVQDTPEAHNLALVYNYWRASKPCRICNIQLHQVGTELAPGPQRYADETREIVNTTAGPIRDHRKRSRDPNFQNAIQHLKDESVHPIRNAFWVPGLFGANPAGIHGALPPEWLHCGQIGLESEVHEAYVKQVDLTHELETAAGSKQPYRKVKKNEGGILLDLRVKRLARPMVRQSERSNPKSSFTAGITDLTKLSGQEMPAVLLMLIISVGDEGAILPVEVSRRFAALTWALLCLDAYIMAPAWDSGMRGRFNGIVRCVRATVKVLPRF